MSLSIATQTAEIGNCDHQRITASLGSLSTGDDVNMEVEEEDEEDVDFNPFLRGESPLEASSSLSSENEVPGDNIEKSLWSSSNGKNSSVSSRPTDETKGCNQDSKNEEETVMQTRLPLEEAYARDDASGNPKELSSYIQQGERLTCLEGSSKKLSFDNGTDATSHITKEELLVQTVNPKNSRKPIITIDDEDAICRRTRARHSLANYTLEELEVFLQESDDDGDLHNVDDQEEYRKFLAAVLLEGVDDEQAGQEDKICDEDEDNDADFEIEIEEALESDVDENIDHNRGRDDRQEGDAHIPETRQKKRLKESAKSNKHLLEQAKMPLRPLLPYVSNAQTSTFPTFAWQFSSPKSFSHCSSSFSGADLIRGFTVHQIGQLYCLIHEHVQLLIQVFSVCVLDPSRQQVASGVQKMISEMINRREEALAWRKVPYPGFCFQPPNLYSSLHFDFHHTSSCSYWTPLIDNPVMTVLDVAPLRLVKSYMTDVSDTVLRYRRSHVESVADKSQLIKEPLFPLPVVASLSDTNNDVTGGIITMSSNMVSPLSPGQRQPKKSLAATLVENTKKQSVALVPKDIAKSAQRFYPLFNSALFPHKPPIPAVANRVLFTDAEDGLLAMGLMEYNNDWAAIQQHFLPCKSKHQIFVRQKNRSSSKATENPIKAVRRMKTSPLTADEHARIYEGLKLFKHDWLSVWKFFVPHRDPSLLPRQWRIATGTQKSYRKSEAVKEKRRVYEAKRRKFKALMTDCQTSSGKEADNEEDNSAGDMDGEDESYVHEAFLADSELGSSKGMSYDISLLSTKRNLQSTNMMPYKGSHISESCASVTNESGESLQESGTMHTLLNSSKILKDTHPSNLSQVRCSSSSSKQLSSYSIIRSSRGQLVAQPFQKRKSKGVQVVKLAPDLPPVNLPPSVRVISQSAFKSYHSESSYSENGENAAKKLFPRFSQVAKTGSSMIHPREHINKLSDNVLETICQQDGCTLAHQFTEEDNTSESDLQMHPLLFQAPEDQFSSFFSTNCHTAASTMYNFFLGNPLQADPNLVRPQHSVRSMDCINVTSHSQEEPSNLCTIDFHPLLQRTDNIRGDSAMASSVARLSGDLLSPQDNCDKFFNPSDCNLRVPLVVTSTPSVSHYEKKNKLDLDICLFSATDREKAKDRDISKHQSVEANKSSDMPLLNCRDKFPEASVANKSSVQSLVCPEKGVYSVVIPISNGDVCQRTEDPHDESMPEIVMEQEELSDSEEESEHVEFEREEIDDSEGEELGCEQPTKIQTKEFLVFASGKEEIQSNNDLRQPHQSSSAQGSAGEGKNCASPMQASQDSSHAKLSRLKPKPEISKRKGSSSSSLNVTPSRPSRSSKKRNTGIFKLHPPRTVQSRANASRKPRKRSP